MTTLTPSRRQALRLAGGSALAGVAVSASATPAAAKTSYRPGRYAATPILDVQARHLVNRFSYGITPQLADEVRAAGGHLAWFDQQLANAYDGAADNLCDWWPDLNLDAAAVWKLVADGTRRRGDVMYDYGRRVLMRRMTSPRQVLEVMTAFWENHLHVPIQAVNVFPMRTSYGELIRSQALGRYEDMLSAAVLHPAMLTFLGAAESTRRHPNENLGRELLELHTVGVGNFTEADVKDAARILTGWRIARPSWDASYVENDHWTGPVRVLEFADPNGGSDGRDLSHRLLSYLARHPSTARRIATKLARVFVVDEPSVALIEKLAATYLDHDTAIAPVLQDLVRMPEFAAAVDQKLRSADRDVIATYRLLGATVGPPASEDSAANAIYFQCKALGVAPLAWPRPDGEPIENRAWSSPTRALASMSLHWHMAAGSWPDSGDGPTFRKPATWLPRRSMTLRDLVDHLSRLLLHRPSTATLLRACCEVVGRPPTARVTQSSDVFRDTWPRLVTTLLDSPEFFQH